MESTSNKDNNNANNNVQQLLMLSSRSTMGSNNYNNNTAFNSHYSNLESNATLVEFPLRNSNSRNDNAIINNTSGISSHFRDVDGNGTLVEFPVGGGVIGNNNSSNNNYASASSSHFTFPSTLSMNANVSSLNVNNGVNNNNNNNNSNVSISEGSGMIANLINYPETLRNIYLESIMNRNTYDIYNNNNMRQVSSSLNIDNNNNNDNNSHLQTIEDLLEKIIVLIISESSRIHNDKVNLISIKTKFKEQLELHLINFKRDVSNYNTNITQYKTTLQYPSTDIIDLNIGGTFTTSTSKQTLTKYPHSALAKMFSGKYKLQTHNGRVFIDRDGRIFQYVLSYLRNGTLPPFDENDSLKESFYNELDYWQIPLTDINVHNKSPFIFDTEWCAETLSIDVNALNKVVNKNHIKHGIIFCSPVMDDVNSYVEFKVNITIPYKGKSLLFVGLVDKSKYKYENLLSSFWKDSPSSFYWDAWSTKLIKIDENGTQVGSLTGYGCHCDSLETTIGIKYNYKEQTIEFYKNGANLGIAFRNVPNGLTPALDIWFENGKVEILNNTQPSNNLFL